MALADRTLPTAQIVPKIDQLLVILPKADADWLREHLTARDERGGYLYSAPALSRELCDEGPATAVGKSAIVEWRRRNA